MLSLVFSIIINFTFETFLQKFNYVVLYEYDILSIYCVIVSIIYGEYINQFFVYTCIGFEHEFDKKIFSQICADPVFSLKTLINSIKLIDI